MSIVVTETITQILIACSMGLLGATIRIFIQYKRDGHLPTDGLTLYAEGFLGLCAGFLSWLIMLPEDLRACTIFAITAGYSASDAIENWLSPKRT